MRILHIIYVCMYLYIIFSLFLHYRYNALPYQHSLNILSTMLYGYKPGRETFTWVLLLQHSFRNWYGFDMHFSKYFFVISLYWPHLLPIFHNNPNSKDICFILIAILIQCYVPGFVHDNTSVLLFVQYFYSDIMTIIEDKSKENFTLVWIRGEFLVIYRLLQP